MDISNDITNSICYSLFSKLENLIIEGLKLKGFEFETKAELENFVKTRCRKTDNIQFKEHIYYVDDIPFFLHKYEIIYEPISEYNSGIKMSANYGYYSFL